jgi:hypothetical protein
MRIKTVAVAALSVVSLLGSAFIVAKVKRFPGKQGFTLLIRTTDYPADGRAPILASTKVRYHKADGSWKMDTSYANGRVDVGFGQMGRGVFHVDEKNKRLDYLSGISLHDRTEADLKSSSDFAGEETLLGFKTLHFHRVSDLTGEVSDTYLCPALQNFPIKAVTTGRNGAKTVYETVQVILGEPSFSTTDYPVDMKHYEEVHGTGTAPAVPK